MSEAGRYGLGFVTSPLEDAVLAAARPAVGEAGGTLPVGSVRQAVLDVLGGGSLDDDTIGELLDVVVHDHEGPLALVPGRRVGDLGLLVPRLVLTHRLTDAELATDTLDLDPDLGPVARLAWVDGGLHTPDGVPLRRRDRRERRGSRAGGVLWTTHLEGPGGWLGRFEAGRVLAVGVAGGVLTLEALDERDAGPGPPGFAAALGDMLELANDGDGSPVWDEELHLGLAVEHPDWFVDPLPPFGDLVVAAGYEVDGRSIGRPGGWQQHEELARVVMTMARHQDLSTDDHDVLRDALTAFDRGIGGGADAVDRADPTAPPARSLRRPLHDRWQAALAFLEELRWQGVTAEQLGGFARALGEGARGEPAAVCQWLASRAAAMDGNALDGERLAIEACESDGWFVPGLDEAAWYAADRGRARVAVNLLHRIRQPDDPELELLRSYAELGAPGIGRNAPCPCGSGRKFKQCHLGRVELPEADRVRWLLDKARAYVMHVAPPELLDDLAGDDAPLHAHLMALDLLLFGDGWFERFLAGRGPLLDEWERTTATRWPSQSVTSVFRVDQIDDDGRRHLVDARTGDVRVVEVSPALDKGDTHRLVWCRLVPVDDRWYTTGVVRLALLGERERLLDALLPGSTSDETMRALVGPGDGPQLQNTSGEPLMTCEAIVRPGAGLHRDDVAARLDKVLERDDEDADDYERDDEDGGGAEGSPVWHLSRDTPGMEQAVIATVRLAASAVHAETNSVARHEEILTVLHDALGDLELESEERVPIACHRARHGARELVVSARRALGLDDDVAGVAEGDDPEDLLDLDDDDDLDDDFDDLDDDLDDFDLDPPPGVLDEMARAHEQRWLDRSIPALGGKTPRDAAADDLLRPDLLTLLAEMGDTGLFDPDRIRAALGLG